MSRTAARWVDEHESDLRESITLAEESGMPRGASSITELTRRVKELLPSLKAAMPKAWFKGLAPRPRGDGSIFSDLAWWIACEHSGDSDLDAVAADAYDGIVTRDGDAVEAYLLRRGSPVTKDLAEEAVVVAFGNAFRYYLRADRKSHFRGQSSVRTLLCVIAQRAAKKLARMEEGRRDYRSRDDDLDLIGNVPGREPAPLEAEEFEAAKKECYGQIKGKELIIAHLRWEEGHSNSEVVELLGISKSNVANYTKRARDIMGPCLESKGFSIGSMDA